MSNMDSTEVEAASVEEATRAALEQLGAREDEVSVEILATPRAGVLGMGARPARVRVTRRTADAATVTQTPAGQAPPARSEKTAARRPPRRAKQRRGRQERPAPPHSPPAAARGQRARPAGPQSA